MTLHFNPSQRPMIHHNCVIAQPPQALSVKCLPTLGRQRVTDAVAARCGCTRNIVCSTGDPAIARAQWDRGRIVAADRVWGGGCFTSRFLGCAAAWSSVPLGNMETPTGSAVTQVEHQLRSGHAYTGPRLLSQFLNTTARWVASTSFRCLWPPDVVTLVHGLVCPVRGYVRASLACPILCFAFVGPDVRRAQAARPPVMLLLDPMRVCNHQRESRCNTCTALEQPLNQLVQLCMRSSSTGEGTAVHGQLIGSQRRHHALITRGCPLRGGEKSPR
jgi:hypothetical protein